MTIKDDGFKFWGPMKPWPEDASERMAEKRRRIDELLDQDVPLMEAIRTVCTRIGRVFRGGVEVDRP